MNFIDKLARIRLPLRPPGAEEESLFQKICIRCRRCAEACPYLSIEIAHGEWGLLAGSPFIHPTKTPCYLCTNFPCIDACPTEALQKVNGIRGVEMGVAEINKDICFAYNGIICRACFERCPIYREAVIMKDELYPEIVTDQCVGCGICEHVCPTEPKSVLVFSKEERA